MDKLKSLNYELGRRDKKIVDQGREIAGLRQELDLYRAGLAEVAAATDALCVDVALKFGAQVGAGVWEARLPKVGTDLLKRYTLETGRDGDTYLLRATRKEDNDHGA